MKNCNMCRIRLKGPFMELFTEDAGIIRNFCPKCIHRMYNKLLLKSVKRREEITLMIWFYNFLKKYQIKIES